MHRLVPCAALLILFHLLFVCVASAGPAVPAPLLEVARQGNPAAQYEMGQRYDRGQGLPEDPAEALHWYRLAAEQGHMMAQFLVGVMYADGRGTPRDLAEAYAWLTLVAARGDEHAEELARRLRAQIPPAQLAEADERAARLQQLLRAVKY